MLINELWHALLGEYGSAGLYALSCKAMVAFTLISPVLLVFGERAAAPCIELPTDDVGLRTFSDAPFGRFEPSRKLSRALAINGKLGWVVMESVAPLSMLGSLACKMSAQSLHWREISSSSLLSGTLSAWSELSRGCQLLAALFVLHYVNRALISTARSPQRAPMHVSVMLAAIVFNALNGFLIGGFIRNGSHGQHLTTATVLRQRSPATWTYEDAKLAGGLVLFVLGLSGNIYADEVLYDLRRTPRDAATSRKGDTTTASRGERKYKIPRGFLYDWPLGGVSFPSYTCEWLEWTGWALAADALTSSAAPFAPSAPFSHLPDSLLLPSSTFLRPPWLFLVAELAVMLPRAIRGHRWYHDTFDRTYPSQRHAVLPGLI